jgi:hypothetical protein
MKSSILIGSYLWKDTWSHWREQPSTVLARLFVGSMLVAVATVILVAFTLLERSIRARLEAFGLNTVVIRETVSTTEALPSAGSSGHDRLNALESVGLKVNFRQLYQRGRSEWGHDLLLLSYPPNVSPVVQTWLSPETPLLCMSDALPENVLVRVTVNRQSAMAYTKRMDPLLRPLGAQGLLLVPQGWIGDAERLGYVETTLFQKRDGDLPIQRVVDSVTQLYNLDQRTPPQIASSVNLLKELERLQERQVRWRQILAAILGSAVALVFGAIAILEFRQNLYICALLRSFGTPTGFLYLRQWIESAFLANLAAIIAIAGVYFLHSKIFLTLGFPRSTLSFAQGNPYLSTEIVLILLCVNVGAFLSSLPVALGLRKPVGEILS